jgi:hypothetical protein
VGSEDAEHPTTVGVVGCSRLALSGRSSSGLPPSSECRGDGIPGGPRT